MYNLNKLFKYMQKKYENKNEKYIFLIKTYFIIFILNSQIKNNDKLRSIFCRPNSIYVYKILNQNANKKKSRQKIFSQINKKKSEFLKFFFD